MKPLALYLGILLFPATPILAQKEALREQITAVAGTIEGQTGVAVMDLSTKDTLIYNTHGIFPMQSVFKFPIALAVLKKVDDKKLSLSKKIKLTKNDLLPNTWSPLREKYSSSPAAVSVEELLVYMVTHSDNNACDILLRLIGGPKKVNGYLRSIGIDEMAIVHNEENMHKTWNAQFDNWSKTRAMLKLLELFYDKKLLSENSHRLLWKWMAETSTGPNRIKGMLPANTEVAHRTGTGGQNDEGVTGAVNDIGIVRLPDGRYFAIVIYLGRVKGQVSQLEKKMAEIAHAVYSSDWLKK